VNFPVQVLKNNLRLIHGSVIVTQDSLLGGLCLAIKCYRSTACSLDIYIILVSCQCYRCHVWFGLGLGLGFDFWAYESWSRSWSCMSGSWSWSWASESWIQAWLKLIYKWFDKLEFIKYLCSDTLLTAYLILLIYLCKIAEIRHTVTFNCTDCNLRVKLKLKWWKNCIETKLKWYEKNYIETGTETVIITVYVESHTQMIDVELYTN